MAKTYLEAHTTSTILIVDYAGSVGGTWAEERIYPGLKTNNVVGSYEFSGYPLTPEKYGIEPGQHIPGSTVHKYLRNVARDFDIAGSIRLRTKVETITRLPDGTWLVDFFDHTVIPASSSTSTSTKTENSDPEHHGTVAGHGQVIASKLVLATGLTSQPFIPPLPGRESFQGHIYHAKDFKSNAENIANCKSVVVIGGNKSAWDVCYSSAAHFGAKAHMVMRRSGGGPSWVWPTKLPGVFSSLAALSSTRLVSWLDPSPFGPSGRKIRAVMNRSWLGRKIISLFWKRLDAKVVSLNAYDAHAGTTGLRPWSSTYWMGNSLSVHNYETSWFDLARNGKITAHAAEVVSLSERAVHLSDGTSIEADVVVCCTGWEAKPNIKFLPEGVADQIGFPGQQTRDPALETQARLEVLESAPLLMSKPNRTLPPGGQCLESCLPVKEHKLVESSPYRLYRFVVPYDHDFIQKHNFAIIGAHITIHTAILSQAQALWITAYFDGKIPHLAKIDGKPDLDKIKHDTFYHTEFERIRRPKETGGAGERYPDLVVDSIPYVDMLLSDLGLPYHRKKSLLREVLEPYRVSDYKGLVWEWKELHRN